MRLLRRLKSRPASKVFGIGTLKTGTTSLGEALSTLGYNNTHENRFYLLKCYEQGNLQPIFDHVDAHDSFEDWPWPLLYREIDARYPNARFILTLRKDDDAWLRSILKHSDVVGPTPGRRLFFGHAVPQGNEAAYLATYRRHTADIRAHFANRPEKLKELCWENGDGWPELCSFLGHPEPDTPFPVLNTAGNRMIEK